MMRLLYKLWLYTQPKSLGGFSLPLPTWLLSYIKKLTLPKQIHTLAVLLKGQDLSYLVNNMVGCAESVTRILVTLGIAPRIITGTYTLYEFLNTSPRFEKVFYPEAGDIILSPSSMGNGKIQGHTGIVGKNSHVLSNDSMSGKFSDNYTLFTWDVRYKVKGGLPVFYYRIIK
jgi:hypothetical protein